MDAERRAELLAWHREHQREQRAAKVRAGLVQPRTYTEIEQFREGLAASGSHVRTPKTHAHATTVPTGSRARTPKTRTREAQTTREGNAVILGEKETAWLLRVVEAARHHGWTVYGNQARNQRPHEPSLVLMHGQRVALVFLRTAARNDRQPNTAYLDKIPGVEVYVWTPKDWPAISATLATARLVAPKWTQPVAPVDGEAADVELGAVT